MIQTRLEYKIVNAHEFSGKPDEKRAQKACDDAAREGWRLVTALAAGGVTFGSGGGKLLLFFEREAR